MSVPIEDEIIVEDGLLPWMIEFRQDYVDGFSVKKRGLDATPMVMRKYDIGPNEVMAFPNYDRRNQAISVFHFHPDFPFDNRRKYMEMHSEGYEVAEEAMTDMKAAAQHQRTERKIRIKSFSRSIAVTFHAMVLYLLTHPPDAR